ncbi:MAG: hypothetical protein A2W90_12580 [Bacteroidetes bacterium GWF2_42_66]|nr:MAG: hypothetical protein A2W92_22845 [Bacteroidetes bacterium GWA2_42_15]OFY00062.1 MAG: hypothetical protein A2W89_17565 [Bacteroidetes bacterium GWE2_42_39]OFY40205.1 MAG: hypothetical protein A2W90_12580 [Bacteroidetes bacterium GWF2_42_66]HBL74037.1 hypothetical protein [Prolixibacteraceae bacterium]HCR89545.1 hypothetical protein [Prolixibacteraceae bacterium]
MRKFFFLVCLFVAVVCAQQAKASSYTVNEQAVDQLFDNVVQTSMISLNTLDFSAMATIGTATVMPSKDKNAVAAILLDFFLGGFGVHRFYLGTKPMTGIGYILTCGGIFGIVPLVDLIVLIIDNEDISKYINNPKFFMW